MSDTLRIGLIGAGGIAGSHAHRLWQLDEVEIPAAADVNPAVEAPLRRINPARSRNLQFFSDHNEMLDKVQLDGVVICTPHTLHHDQILRCLQAGLHVLTEKPMVCSAAEAKSVIAAAKKAGKHLLVSYQRHTSPAYQYMRQVVEAGELGQIVFTQAFLAQNWLESQRGTWRQDPKLSGGGQLNDSGSHVVDIVLWISGLAPESVTAFIRNFDVPVDINSAVSVSYANGAAGNFSILGSYPAGMPEQTSLVGTAGALHYQSLFGQARVVQVRADGTPLEVLKPFGPTDPDRHFIDVLRGRCESLLTPESALRTIALTEAAWKSSDAGGAAVPVEAV